MRLNAAVFLMLIVASSGTAQTASSPGTPGRILKLEELSWTDVDKLDRQRTIFILTFGNLEEHGPHLPIASDYFQATAVRDGVVQRLRKAHPDRAIVLFPVVPLGEGGANDAAGEFNHPGTFAVRFQTLRDVAADLGASIARQGFKNVLLLHNHGAPLHNKAFTQAAQFVSERYGARMVNVTSLLFGQGFYSNEIMARHLGKDWEQKLGFEGHAGAAETSANLAVRPDLVKPDYRKLSPFVARDMVEFLRTTGRPGWRGYWGAPALATPALGRELMADFAERSFQIAQKALAGEDLSRLPTYPEMMPPIPEFKALIEKGVELYGRQTDELQEWLKKRGEK